MKPTLLIAALFAAAALRPTPAQAQDPANLVWNQLQAMYLAVAENNAYDIQKYVVGKLGISGEDAWTFTITEGFDVTVIGACDADCADLDIRILDSKGNLVTEDTLVDDQPVVTFTAETAGQFTVVATMVQCSAEPCYFGFGVMIK